VQTVSLVSVLAHYNIWIEGISPDSATTR